MKVIYAEKPDVARKIAAAIGPIKFDDGTVCTYDKLSTYEKKIKAVYMKQGYIPIKWKGEDTVVTWGYGHLCGLYELLDYDEEFKNWRNIDLPYIPAQYKLKYKKDTYSQFKVVKELFNKADLIINATDWDREGEVIFAYAYEVAKCKKPFKRAYYVSQNEQAFNEAFDNLTDAKDVYPLEQAGRCRGIADWLVGMNLTVAATLRGGSSVMSIGRVQTPTLAMVVDREKKIRDFKPTKYYVPKGVFTTAKGETYKGEYAGKDKITDKADAESLFKKLTGSATVISVEKKSKKVGTPSLYSLGLIQMEANSKFGFTANETLDIVQSLYEAGVVTYPRTNSAYLPEDYRPIATKALNALANSSEYGKYLKGKKYNFNKKYFDDSKVESHFAIVPTHVLPHSLTDRQQKIYDLIAKSLIVTIYPEAVLEETKLVTEDNGLKFNSKGSIIKDAGWMEVIPGSKDTILPSLKEKENVKGEYELAEKETQPPARYTDKTLIAAMISADKDADEKDIMSLAELNIAGIGTEATRANIIETLVRRGYIERNKKSFAATDTGIALIDNFPVEDVKSAYLTAQWETRLHDISLGKEDPQKFIKDVEATVGKWCKETEKNMVSVAATVNSNKTGLTCPICGENIVKQKWGYGCSGYKNGCKFSVSNTIASKKLTDKQIETLITKGQTAVIKGFKSKAGKPFNARLVLEDNKVQFKFDK